MKKNALALLGVATLAVAGQASASQRLPDGLYSVEVYHHPSAAAGTNPWGGCMIVSNNGSDHVPSLYHWGRAFNGWGECGLGGFPHALLHNRQAVWQVYTVASASGQQAYVIKSHANGACLIRGENGYAGRPSLHLWTETGGNARYCGFRSADELVRNGQAAWSLDVGWGFGNAGRVVNAAWTGSADAARLGFAPLPPVFPNTFDRYSFASFGAGESPWWYFFARLDL